MDKSENTAAVCLERGIISAVREDAAAGYVYRVKSLTRDDIESRWMEAVNACVNEYSGDPPQRDKYAYEAGDLVNYFMFGDGRGMIIGRVRKDLK